MASRRPRALAPTITVGIVRPRPGSALMRARVSSVLTTTSALAPMPFSRRWSRTAQRPAVTGGEIVKASDGEAKLAVGAACAGAVLFGYHLGVVNAPLDAMARSL